MSSVPVAAVAAAVVLLTIGARGQDTFAPEHLERARKLHRESVVVDTHSDVTPSLEDPGWDFGARHPVGHMDIPRLREGGITAEFFSVWMGATPGDGRAIKTALVRIDALHEAVRRHPAHLELASTAADVRRIKAAGRIACLLGIEGGHIIEENLPALRTLHRLGCRYMTLTHGFNTAWADSSGTDQDLTPEHQGLAPLGVEIVQEMNRLGMMVDVSHVSDATFWHTLRVTRAPVIASHSSARGVYAHRRNLSDDMLRALRDNRGVAMINFFNGYIDPEWPAKLAAWEAEHQAPLAEIAAKYKANLGAAWRAREAYVRDHPMPRTALAVLARHVEHVARVAGWEHVGIGADWDGVPALPDQMAHCGELPNLTALLLARGAKEDDLRLFLGENLLRVMEQNERVAAELRHDGR